LSPNSPLRDWSELNPTQTATAKAGETLSDIARRLGVDLKALAAANPQLADPGNLKAGQLLQLPPTALPSAGPTPGATSAIEASSAVSSSTLPSAPIGDPLASVVVQGTLAGPYSNSEGSATGSSGTTASPLTAADLKNLSTPSAGNTADPDAAQTLQLVGWSATLTVADQQRASQIVGSVDGASGFLQSLLAPYFSLQTDGEVREDTGASSKLRADAIQALQNEMLFTSVRLAQTASPGFNPLNVSGEDTVRSISELWKDDTSQNLNDVLKHAMAAARMMKSREHAQGQLHEIAAKLSALMSQAIVVLANALAEAHHNPKHCKGHKSVA
jgi:hypothetical protein